MPRKSTDISLPLYCPDTESLRTAVTAILGDIRRESGDDFAEIGKKLGVHKNTVGAWYNQANDMGALVLAKLGAIYGKEYLRPYETLYEGDTAPGVNPLPQLANAVATLCDIGIKGTPKQRLDALPVLKLALSALDACIAETERLRLA